MSNKCFIINYEKETEDKTKTTNTPQRIAITRLKIVYRVYPLARYQHTQKKFIKN